MTVRRSAARAVRARPVADPAATLREALESAGAAGCTAAKLRLAGRSAPALARRALIEEWVAAGRVTRLGQRAALRYFLPALAPTEATVAARLLEVVGPALPDGPISLWGQPELARKLTSTERQFLGLALARLEVERLVLTVVHRKSRFLLFSAQLNFRLPPAASSAPRETQLERPAYHADSRAALLAAYAKLVNESGGFPDVRIARVRRELAWPALDLETLLLALWREGGAALSLGDWSLADEETRAAAVTLDGERYLLVRLE